MKVPTCPACASIKKVCNLCEIPPVPLPMNSLDFELQDLRIREQMIYEQLDAVKQVKHKQKLMGWLVEVQTKIYMYEKAS